MDPKTTPKRPRRGRKLEWRLNEIRRALAVSPLSDADVIRKFTAKPEDRDDKGQLIGGWGVTPRTIERLIRTVRDEAAFELDIDRRQLVAQMVLEIRTLYKLCVSKGKLEAAGRCQDRYMRLIGLEAARRVELTGRDGAPMAIARASYDLSERTDEELEVLERTLGITPGETTH